MNASQKSEARKFWKDAYIAAMAEMVGSQIWKMNGKDCTTPTEKSAIARGFADCAVANLKKASL